MPDPSKNPGSFVVTLDEDEDGNLFLPFPEELLEALGWCEGDTLEIYTVHTQVVFRKVED